MNFLGYFFSVYCVYKMVMATVNIIFHRTRKKGLWFLFLLS